MGVGGYLARDGLRAQARWLALALAGAFAVGGIWYARNLVDHGSPLWPFTAAPWGDPTPPFLKLVRTTLLQRPVATLSGRWGTYSALLGGAVVVLAGAVLVLFRGALGFGLARPLRRELVIAGAVAVLALLAWSAAPGTGLQTAPGLLFPLSWPASTIRYMLPALGAATVAVALAARAGGLTAVAVTVALAAAVVWNAVKDAQLGLPYVPSLRTLVVGAAAGILVAWAAAVAHRSARRRARGGGLLAGRSRALVRGVPALAAIAFGAVLAPASDGFVRRHAQLPRSTALGQGVAAWFAAQPGFDTGHGAIAFASRALQAPLAGDHFTHPLELIPAGASCAAVLTLARTSTVVVTAPQFLRGLLGDRPYGSGACLAGRHPTYRDPVFSVYRPG